MSLGLEVRDLVAGYKDTVVLDGVSLSLAAGQGLALLGRNGVGKTTLLSAIAGVCNVFEGSIQIGQTKLDHVPVHKRAELGLGYVPQEREVFKSLTVAENVAVSSLPDGWTFERIVELFPRLAERRHSLAGRLSGGEQQMLAIARALAGNPKLLLLDEPLEGLAPVVVDSLLDAFVKIRRDSGVTMILVEQKAELALSVAERAIVLDRGRIRFDGASSELAGNEEAQARLLSVSDGAVL